MKELSIEQKAQRYDEAIEIAKEINNEQRAQPFNVMTKVFPELKESEDERIRKALIKSFEIHDLSALIIPGFSAEEVITWLEKQGGQTPAWSEEDERNASYICAALDCYYRLREDRNNTNGQENLDKAINWLYNKLKSLRPQKQWKPSEEQLKQLGKYCPDNTALTALYEYLKTSRIMTQEDKEQVIKIAAEWLELNLPDKTDKRFWIEDFVNYLDIQL